MNSQTTEDSLQQGISYLVNHQRKNGSFAIRCSNSKHSKAPLANILSMHALMLDCLLNTGDKRLQSVAERLAAYLSSTLLPLTTTKLATIDSFALFYSLAVIYRHDVTALSPETLASAISGLLAAEQTPGGPYYNALDSRDAAPDWLTNVVIDRFVRSVGGPLPNLSAYLDKEPPSYNRYYTKDWPLSFIDAQRQETSSTQPRHRISVTTALQLSDGSWPIDYICQGEKANLTYGSAGLSTAAMVANLSSATATASDPDYYTQLAGIAQSDAAALDPLIGQVLQSSLTKLITADTTYEIGPLAERFAATLDAPRKPKAQTLQTLGLANLYNWVAYTIYDDFLDDEGDRRLLPAATVAMRKAVQLFGEAVPDPAFAARVQHTFTAIDTANAWELANCRFAVHNNTIQVGAIPSYGKLQVLYGRSLSHGLPIIGTLLAAGFTNDSPAVTAIAHSFQHYLIIRQLNDDLCDWEDDLHNGHISYVVAQLLHDAHIEPGKHPLDSLHTTLQPTFWTKSLAVIDSTLQEHANKARQLLTTSHVLAPDNLILQLTNALADVAQKMDIEHQHTNDFLQEFRSQQ